MVCSEVGGGGEMDWVGLTTKVKWMYEVELFCFFIFYSLENEDHAADHHEKKSVC